jgi:hypothetical protein
MRPKTIVKTPVFISFLINGGNAAAQRMLVNISPVLTAAAIRLISAMTG